MSKRALTKETLEAFIKQVSEDLKNDPLARITKRRVGGARTDSHRPQDGDAKVVPPRGGDG